MPELLPPADEPNEDRRAPAAPDPAATSPMERRTADDLLQDLRPHVHQQVQQGWTVVERTAHHAVLRKADPPLLRLARTASRRLRQVLRRPAVPVKLGQELTIEITTAGTALWTYRDWTPRAPAP